MDVVWVKIWPLRYTVGGGEHYYIFILVLALPRMLVYSAA